MAKKSHVGRKKFVLSIHCVTHTLCLVDNKKSLVSERVVAKEKKAAARIQERRVSKGVI